MSFQSMRQIIDLVESLTESQPQKLTRVQRLNKEFSGREIKIIRGSNRGLIGKIEYFYVDDGELLVGYKVTGGQTSDPKFIRADIGDSKWARPDEIDIYNQLIDFLNRP